MTTIEWTDETWNPLRGCSRISEGCRNCYAERMAARFSGPGKPFEGLATMTPHGPRWTGVVRLLSEELETPLRWKKPRMVFVNSMSDLFHEKVPDEFIAAVFAVMAMTPQHTYQILTKRADRMAEWFRKVEKDPAAALVEGVWFNDILNEETECALANYVNGWSRWRDMPDDGNPLNGTVRRWPLPNVWLVASTEDQKTFDERVPDLLKCPAVVRGVSAEPLLGPLDMERHLMSCEGCGNKGSTAYVGYEQNLCERACIKGGEGPSIDWVITGAESGPGARPMNEDWVRSLRDQCQAAGVPFFYKQRLDEKGHKVSLPELDGRKWAEFPEVKTA